MSINKCIWRQKPALWEDAEMNDFAYLLDKESQVKHVSDNINMPKQLKYA